MPSWSGIGAAITALIAGATTFVGLAAAPASSWTVGHGQVRLCSAAAYDARIVFADRTTVSGDPRTEIRRPGDCTTVVLVSVPHSPEVIEFQAADRRSGLVRWTSLYSTVVDLDESGIGVTVKGTISAPEFSTW